MNRNYLLLIMVAFISATTSFSVLGQSIQNGVVLLYDGSKDKSPVAGVSLDIRYANSVITDKNGKFSLRFPTLKNGDKISVRYIRKDGFEVFNKQAIEQWNLNSNTSFRIILCKSEMLKKLHDQYYAAIFSNYKNQFDKDRRELERLRSEGNLKESEFQSKLQKAQELYDSKLDNIETFLDRFIRIDLSEISSEEKMIIDLVKQGDLENAILKYEQLNLVGQHIQMLINRNEKTKTIDKLESGIKNDQDDIERLYESVDRYIDVLKLGGRDNFQKIKDIYSAITSADPMNVSFLMSAGLFSFRSLLDYELALKYYDDALLPCMSQFGYNSSCMADLYFNIGNVYEEIGEYSKALDYHYDALRIYNDIYGEKSVESAPSYNSLGIVYYQMGNFQVALDNYNINLEIISRNENYETENLATLYNNLSVLYSSLKDFSKALEFNLEALRIYESLYGPDHTNVAGACSNLGNLYAQLMDYDSAMKYHKRSIAIRQNVFGEIHRYVASSYLNMGVVEESFGKYESASNFFQKAVDMAL